MGPPLLQVPQPVSGQQSGLRGSNTALHVQLLPGHHLPMSSPLIFAPPIQNGPGNTPEHQEYLAHHEYRLRLAYTAYHGVTGSVEG